MFIIKKLNRSTVLLGLFAITSYTLLAGSQPKSAKEKIAEANTKLASITGTIQLASQVKAIVNQENPPCQQYRYDKPYTPDISELSNFFCNKATFNECIDERENALQEDRSVRDTPQYWERFLQADKQLCLDTLNDNQEHWEKDLSRCIAQRNRDFYNYQKELITTHTSNDVLFFCGTVLGSVFTLEAIKRIKPHMRNHVFMERLDDSLGRTLTLTLLMHSIYQTRKLKGNNAITDYFGSVESLIDAPNPQDIIFPKLHLLDNKKFMPLFILLDLLHTYGLDYKNIIIASERWQTVTRKIEQWLKSKINRYNIRKKRLARIAQKLRLRALFSTVPFITKLFLATYPSHTCIDVEPLKNAGI